MKSRSTRTKRIPKADQVDPKTFALEMYPHTITVNGRTDDYHACFEDGGWSAGKTVAEAVGSLILSHGRERGMPVNLTESGRKRFEKLQEESLKKALRR